MASNGAPPAFTSHQSDSVTSLLNATLANFRELLELIDQSCDQNAGAHVQAAIDGITIFLAQRAHGRAVLITDFPSATLINSALASGFASVLEKPLRQHDLIAALRG